MKIDVRKSFEKDITSISDKKLAKQLKSVIKELEDCKSLTDVRHVKKMAGKGSYYRIRVGQHRLGFKLEGDILILLRFMPRKDIYNYFP